MEYVVNFNNINFMHCLSEDGDLSLKHAWVHICR